MVLPGTASASAPYEYLSVQPTEMVFMRFTVADTNVIGVLYDNPLSSSPAGPALFLPVLYSIDNLLLKGCARPADDSSG
jgi:hypothetical protein